MQHRRLVIAALTVAAVGLSACSDSNPSSSLDTTLATGGSSTTSTEESTTTTAAPVVVTQATEPPTTLAPTTLAPTTTTIKKYKLYEEVPLPNVPKGHTDPFLSSGTLANGVYWVNYNGGETQTPDITVMQAFFGAECQSMAQQMGDECVDDIYVLGDPSRDINDLPFASNVFLTVSDSNTQKSYWITPDELRTIRASSPSDGAPDNFSFSSFPMLMTVKNGKITKFEQVWTP